jgi:hypothetical protein
LNFSINRHIRADAAMKEHEATGTCREEYNGQDLRLQQHAIPFFRSALRFFCSAARVCFCCNQSPLFQNKNDILNHYIND